MSCLRFRAIRKTNCTSLNPSFLLSHDDFMPINAFPIVAVCDGTRTPVDSPHKGPVVHRFSIFVFSVSMLLNRGELLVIYKMVTYVQLRYVRLTKVYVDISTCYAKLHVHLCLIRHSVDIWITNGDLLTCSMLQSSGPWDVYAEYNLLFAHVALFCCIYEMSLDCTIKIPHF